jgi:hypothetical protein
LNKTKICKFNLAGCCSKGSACTFAHDPDELKAPPDFTRTTLCKFFRQQGWCDNADCKFAHSSDELSCRVAPRADQSQLESSTNGIETTVKTSTTAGGRMKAFDPDIWLHACDRDHLRHIDRSQAATVYKMNQNMDKGWLEPPLEYMIPSAGVTDGTVIPRRAMQDFGYQPDMGRRWPLEHADLMAGAIDGTLRPYRTEISDFGYQNPHGNYPVSRMSPNMDTQRLESSSEYSMSSAGATAIRPHRNHNIDSKWLEPLPQHSAPRASAANATMSSQGAAVQDFEHASMSASNNVICNSLDLNASQCNFTGDSVAPSRAKMSSVADTYDASIQESRWQ